MPVLSPDLLGCVSQIEGGTMTLDFGSAVLTDSAREITLQSTASSVLLCAAEGVKMCGPKRVITGDASRMELSFVDDSLRTRDGVWSCSQLHGLLHC